MQFPERLEDTPFKYNLTKSGNDSHELHYITFFKKILGKIGLL
jgi:hypothetical protein